MTFRTILFASWVGAIGVAASAEAQFVEDQILVFAQQAPAPGAPATPPTPPVPPIAPSAPFQDMLRMMSADGSYLGVGVIDIDAESKRTLNLKEERGAEITSVEAESPADKAGLKKGDVVLEYNGQRVEGSQQFIRMVRETPAGREVKIGIVRGGNALTVSAKPADGSKRMQGNVRIMTVPGFQPRPYAFTIDTPRPMISWNSGMLGIEAESLEGQFAEFLGVKQGVLVRSVGKNTPAEKAGVRAGDVIVKVDETKVSTPREVTSAVRALTGSKKSLALTVVREKKETALNLNLEQQPQPAEAPARPRVRSVQNKFF